MEVAMVRACFAGVVRGLVLIGASGSSAIAAETCHSASGQYAETRTCVSSVLAPQGGNTYGPDKLNGGDGNGAWCEGIDGSGVGQTITLHQKQGNVIGSLSFVNGYTKTPQLFRANGRIKQARIETSNGYRKTVNLPDTTEWQNIAISPSKVSWVRLTILAVYPGMRGSDTCVTTFYLNQEDFLDEPEAQ
jgi:hypothetical protein